MQSFSDYALRDEGALRWESPDDIRIAYSIDAGTANPEIAPTIDEYFSKVLPTLSDVIGRRVAATADSAKADILVLIVGDPIGAYSRFQPSIDRVLLGRVNLGAIVATAHGECLAYARAQNDEGDTQFLPDIGVRHETADGLRAPDHLRLTAGILIASVLKGSDSLKSCMSHSLPRLLGVSGAAILPSMRLAYSGHETPTEVDPFDLELLRGLYRTDGLHSGDTWYKAMALYKQFLLRNSQQQ